MRKYFNIFVFNIKQFKCWFLSEDLILILMRDLKEDNYFLIKKKIINCVLIDSGSTAAQDID